MDSEQRLNWLVVCDVSEIGPYIGQRIRSIRLGLGESQEHFAKKAGVALRTFKRLEVDGSGKLDTLLRVLRTIDRTKYVYLLFPNDPPPKRVRRRPGP